MDKVSASQPRDRGFGHYTGDDHDSSHDTSTGWFQEADSKVIYISSENLFHNRAKLNKFKLKYKYIYNKYKYRYLTLFS